ncbi:homeobox protein 2-like [Hermetia illucens]|uniref:homeobox protein 2-like n=1 Tax=Hermetia illucens TaxID=343691 RepID=UPI0018CC654E|nr:homeobox protein 2-like [Hermetia illucens]
MSTPRELFDNFRIICNSLNELYEFDDNKPTNYSPENNNKNLVDVVKDMLTGSNRISIPQNMSLIEVFNKFDDLGLLDETEVIHCSYRKNRNRDVNRKKFRNGNFKNSGNKNFQSHYRSNDPQPNSDYNNFKPNRCNNNFNHDNNNNKNNSQRNQYNHSSRTKNYNSKPTDDYNQKYSNYNTDNSGQFLRNTNSEQCRKFDNNSSENSKESNNKNSRQFKT